MHTVTKKKRPFFSLDTSSHRDRGIVRVLPFVHALLAAVVVFLHTITKFFFRTVAVVVYSLRFFPHRDSCLAPLLQLLFRHDN